ncbi:MAG: LysR family transcriptional regulator [Desulfobacterales bacterium]|nr:LysR family transcriptional regulator [Desulfobacterales bacterium]
MDDLNLELRLLRYFVAVYEEKSITAASKRCHISQPSLSNAVRQLEETLGTQLFIRHKKGMEMTPSAHHLYPSARKILKDARDLSRLFVQGREPVGIGLGVFPDLSPSRLKHFLQWIRKNIPGIALELLDHGDDAHGRLTLDLFKGEDEIFTPLWEEDYLVCLPPDHGLAGEGRITSAMLHEHPFIECPPCEAHQQTMGILAGEGMELNISSRAEHKGQVLQLIRAGYGISFLPLGVAEYAPDIITRPFEGPRMFRRIGLTHRAGGRGDSPIGNLVDILNSVALEGLQEGWDNPLR